VHHVGNVDDGLALQHAQAEVVKKQQLHSEPLSVLSRA
jgi:hypothetical protein